jgi:hypothetical protein
MVYATNFIVRKSGIREGSYYIDYAGSFSVTDLSKIVGLKPSRIVEIYTSYGGILNDSLGVYYFPSAEHAKNSIDRILSEVKPGNIGKAVYLSNEEIDYIRRALINEGANTFSVKNNLKDEIFRKLNEV